MDDVDCVNATTFEDVVKRITFSACLPSLVATTVIMPDAPASIVNIAVCAPVGCTATFAYSSANDQSTAPVIFMPSVLVERTGL